MPSLFNQLQEKAGEGHRLFGFRLQLAHCVQAETLGDCEPEPDPVSIGGFGLTLPRLR